MQVILNKLEKKQIIKEMEPTINNKKNTIALRWCIVDENNNFVHKNSIKRISKQEYTYTCYSKIERMYPTFEMVNEVLNFLNLHNVIGKLGHTFRIVEL